VPSTPFLKPKFIGPRFESHEIPLEVLRDLAALEAMIEEVAKWQFLRDNPSRRRLPRGFLEGVSLKVAAVEEGSAIPVIVLSVAATFGQLEFPSIAQQYLETSRDAIVAAIGSAEQSKPITNIPSKYLKHFDVFGSSLRDGEAIEFPPGSTGGGSVKLTRESHRRLLAAASQDVAQIKPVKLIGVVPEADQDRNRFEIQLEDGQKVPIRDLEKYRDTILEAFQGYESRIRVRLRGEGKFELGKLRDIASIDEISVIEPLDVELRIEALKKLEDGWMDGQGAKLIEEELSWFVEQFDRNYPEQFVLPHLYPTLDGGLRAEWTLGNSEASLELSLSTRAAAWHELNLESDQESINSLNLNNVDDWKWMAVRLEQLGGLRND
jgi:hypothetical protein